MLAFGRVDPMSSAIERILEVAVGAAIGLLVALVVAPSTAIAFKMRRAAVCRRADTAETMGVLVQGVLNATAIGTAMSPTRNRIGVAMVALDAVGGEAERERLFRLDEGAETGPMRRLRCCACGSIWYSSAAPLARRSVGRCDEQLRPLLEDVVAGASAWLRDAAVALHRWRRGRHPHRRHRTLAAAAWTAGSRRYAAGHRPAVVQVMRPSASSPQASRWSRCTATCRTSTGS